jgi:predicted nucleic acid-binding protein
LKQSIIDASVVLKWYLPDEEYGDKAMGLLKRYIAGDLELISPSLIEYELANGLIIACRRGRIKEENVVSAMEGFTGLGLRLVDVSDLYAELVRYCKRYKLSAYDDIYLALVGREGIDLITADKRFYNSVKVDLSWVIWLGDIHTKGQS